MRTTLLIAVALALVGCAGDPCEVLERAAPSVPNTYPYRFGVLVCEGRETGHCTTDPRPLDGVSYTVWGDWNCWSPSLAAE